MPFKGFDCFTPDAGKYDTMHCHVCNTEMNIQKNCSGPRSYVEAMAGQAGYKFKRLHDTFTCPHTDEDWHKQALDLTRAAQNTPSQKLTELLLSERAEVIKSKARTKKSYWFF